VIEGAKTQVEGTIFDIDNFAIHDGPGIRMSVYLKGCPLACKWCHSPESQKREPQLVFAADRCIQCGACITACPNNVHSLTEDRNRTIDWAKCQTCGACVEACAPGALSIKGYVVSADSIVERARRMMPFFTNSSGGVTLTGGEVTMQTDFAEAVLSGCKAIGIHTAIETCGATSWDRLKRLLRHTDLVLYDVKLYDEEEHRRWTGSSNRQILANASRLVGRNVQIRVPLIPDITDTEANLRGIYAFMGEAGLRSVALLPYNTSAGAKYEWLERPYEISGETQSEEKLESLLDLAQQFGVEAVAD